ncbi:MAG: hypothetical protein RLQ25_12645 [Alphaproteobacteria bacterium]
MMDLGVGPFLGLLILFYPVWRILQRAGFSPWLTLLLLLPGLGLLILMLLLAFADWPAKRRDSVP